MIHPPLPAFPLSPLLMLNRSIGEDSLREMVALLTALPEWARANIVQASPCHTRLETVAGDHALSAAQEDLSLDCPAHWRGPLLCLPLKTDDGAPQGLLLLEAKAAPNHSAEAWAAHLAPLLERAAVELRRLAVNRELEGWRHRLDLQNRILKMAAAHRPLPDILNHLLQSIEAENPGMACSIMLPERDRPLLNVVAAPSLPPDYVRCLRNIEIGEGIGSCGTAAHSRERVIVPDIATHAFWTAFRHHALPHGLRSCWSQPVLNGQGQLLGVFAIYRQRPGDPSPQDLGLIDSVADLASVVLENYQTLDELTRRATLDDLTGLSNRPTFMAQLASEFRRSQRHGRPLSVLMLDLDHFKLINDTHGHQAGDQVIRAIAELFRRHLRQGDIVGRIGGEEFAFVLPETGTLGAKDAADKIRQVIERSPITVTLTERTVALSITCSIGFAILTGTERSHEDLLSLADGALYEAKAQGRNRVCSALGIQ